MDKKSDILDKIGKDAGFRVPEGYFAEFERKMAESLPERTFPQVKKPTVWLRIRPYVYMAAMFAGVWCMLYLFNDLKKRSGDIGSEGQIAEAMKDTDMVNELIKSGQFDEQDLIEQMMNDSMASIDDSTL